VSKRPVRRPSSDLDYGHVGSDHFKILSPDSGSDMWAERCPRAGGSSVVDCGSEVQKWRETVRRHSRIARGCEVSQRLESWYGRGSDKKHPILSPVGLDSGFGVAHLARSSLES